MAFDLTEIPPEFGKGGANIDEGTPNLRQLLSEHKDTLNTAGHQLDSALTAAFTAEEQAFGALAASFKKYTAVAFSFAFSELDPGIKSLEIEFNQGDPLPSDARFLIAHLFQAEVFDNVGHTLISASVGTHSDPEKYMSITAINDGAKSGKTFTASGDGGLFLLAPIGGDAPIIKITSPDDLNTIVSGTVDADLFYTTP